MGVLVAVVVIAATVVFLVTRKTDGLGTQHTITLQVTGSGSRDSVIYLTPDGQKNASVTAPWSTTFRVSGGTKVSISARASGGGSIGCVISEDGTTLVGSGSGSVSGDGSSSSVHGTGFGR